MSFMNCTFRILLKNALYPKCYFYDIYIKRVFYPPIKYVIRCKISDIMSETWYIIWSLIYPYKCEGLINENQKYNTWGNWHL